MKRISVRNSIAYGLIVILLGALVMFFVSTRQASRPEVTREPVGNFDAETQAMIASANRVVFLIPFSHWDTDWHQDFGAYSKLADKNILKAIIIIVRERHPIPLPTYCDMCDCVDTSENVPSPLLR